MKSAGDEMIRLAVAIGFVCGGCNRVKQALFKMPMEMQSLNRSFHPQK